MEATTNPTTTPGTDWTVPTVQSLTSDVVHVAGSNRTAVWSACNGRRVAMPITGQQDPTAVTCKRCRKALTA